MLTKTVTAIWDGKLIHPDEPLPLPRDTRITITVHAEEPRENEDRDVGVSTFLDVALSLKICGPPDWSERVDYYMGQDMSGYNDNPDLDEGKI